MGRASKKQAPEIQPVTALSPAKPTNLAAAAKEVKQGWRVEDVALRYGLDVRGLVAFLKENAETVRDLNDNVRLRAATQREKNLDALIALRDGAKNDMARIKAIQAIDERAGLSFEKQTGGVSITVFGQSVNVKDLEGSEIEEFARALSAKLGPEAERVVDAEFSVAGPAREGEGGDTGGSPAGTPQGDPASPPTQAE